MSTCVYHKNKPSAITCERCNRPICIDDRKIFSQSQKYGPAIVKEFCVICYAAFRQEQVSPSSIGYSFIILEVLAIFLLAFQGFSVQVIITCCLILAGILVVVLVYYKSVADEATTEALEFKNRLNLDKNAEDKPNTKKNSQSQRPEKNRQQIKRDLAKLSCFECGHRLDFTDLFCPNCGDDTEEERKIASVSV